MSRTIDEKTKPGAADGDHAPRRAVHTQSGEQLAGHLVRLPGEEWAVWRWAGLRGAGFPAGHLLKLAAGPCAEAADAYLAAEEESLRCCEEARAALRRELQQAVPPRRQLIDKALKRLDKAKPPAPDGLPDAVRDFAASQAKAAEAFDEFERLFRDATLRTSETIRELATGERFQEAVIWQNRRALHTAILPLVRKGAGGGARGSKQRQHEQLVAKYLQRYCAKNDTIGFFGPVGWARFTDDAVAVEVRAGDGLIAEREVYFEVWCLDMLAAALEENRAVLRWVAPRLMPSVRLEGETLRLPFKEPLRLSPEQAAILRRCDGERRARDIAVELVSDSGARLHGEAEVYSLLEAMRARKIVAWGLEVPLVSHPELALGRALERVGDEGLRASALDALAELERARAKLREAAGDPARLDRAFQQLEETFTRLTGRGSTRAEGKTYAGRTLVYEDCRRAAEVEIGADVLARLGPALSLLLMGARWLTHRVAEKFRRTFDEVYAVLVRESGAGPVEFINFWWRVQPLLFSSKSEVAETAVSEFQERWAQVLSLPPDARRVQYDGGELLARARAAFAAPGSAAAWSSAKYHSPDIMIAAPDAEALRRGDYEIIVGELHVASNTLAWNLFLAQHPAPHELSQAFESDLPRPRLVPVIPKEVFGEVARVLPALFNPGDLHLEVSACPTEVAASARVPMSALFVERASEGLRVRSRDGAVSFDIIEALGPVLTTVVTNLFSPLRPAARTPRVTVDGVVICRETWRFTPEEVDFAFVQGEADRFLAARDWFRRFELPRFAFVKVPVERKPFYVDFESPIYVDILAKTVRRTADEGFEHLCVSVVEMSPQLDELWLPDGDGQLCTGEFRIVAVDLKGEGRAAP